MGSETIYSFHYFGRQLYIYLWTQWSVSFKIVSMTQRVNNAIFSELWQNKLWAVTSQGLEWSQTYREFQQSASVISIWFPIYRGVDALKGHHYFNMFLLIVSYLYNLYDIYSPKLA